MNSLFKKSYLLKAILLIFCLLVFFMPFDFKIVEKREFKVVDINGNAIENAIVRQTWYQYAIGYRKESTHHTSSDGFALLPKRTVSTTLFDLVCGSVAKIYEYRINASFKSSDTITIHAENHGRKTFHDGKGMESKTVVLN